MRINIEAGLRQNGNKKWFHDVIDLNCFSILTHSSWHFMGRFLFQRTQKVALSKANLEVALAESVC
jgi:hypothetical protein